MLVWDANLQKPRSLGSEAGAESSVLAVIAGGILAQGTGALRGILPACPSQALGSKPCTARGCSVKQLAN